MNGDLHMVEPHPVLFAPNTDRPARWDRDLLWVWDNHRWVP